MSEECEKCKTFAEFNIGLEFYVDRAGMHRWRAVSDNGIIMGSSNRGHKSKYGAVQNAFWMNYVEWPERNYDWLGDPEDARDTTS